MVVAALEWAGVAVVVVLVAALAVVIAAAAADAVRDARRRPVRIVVNRIATGDYGGTIEAEMVAQVTAVPGDEMANVRFSAGGVQYEVVASDA